MAPLRRSTDFDRVLTDGRRRRVGAITVVTAPGGADVPRVGLIVGRKVGNAVKRNRAKRRLRAALREVGVPSGDHVVIGSAGVLRADFAELRRWLADAMEPR